MTSVDEYNDDPSNRMVVTWSGDDGDGIGRLSVTASADGYAGVGSAWFDRERVIELGLALGRFPLPEEVIGLSGGFGATGDRPAEEHVAIDVGAVGVRGQLGVRVHLASEVWPDTRPEALHEVRLELLTTYQRLGQFGDHLVRVVNGRLSEAVLGGEKLVSY